MARKLDIEVAKLVHPPPHLEVVSGHIPVWGTPRFFLWVHFMDSAQDSFSLANTHFRKADYTRWHRAISKQHILRSQLGFNDVTTSRPKLCQGCVHYHGVAYGYSKANRSVLVCGFHPFGWQSDACPDWSDHQ